MLHKSSHEERELMTRTEDLFIMISEPRVNWRSAVHTVVVVMLMGILLL